MSGLLRANGTNLSVRDGAGIIEMQVNRLLGAGLPPLMIVDILCEMIAVLVGQTELRAQRAMVEATILSQLPRVIDKHCAKSPLDYSPGSQWRAP